MRSWILCLVFCLVSGLSVGKASAQYQAFVLPAADYSDAWLLKGSLSYQIGSGYGPVGYRHALLWNFDAGEPVDLTPAGYLGTDATDISGNLQVGYSSDANYNIFHALLWHGSADSVVDLHPANAGDSAAFGAYSGDLFEMQVGYFASDIYQNNRHAALWFGTPDSMVDLHPAGYLASTAWATKAYAQVGVAAIGSIYNDHAMLWYGSADSYVDLSSPAYQMSLAYDLDENTNSQVGYARIAGYEHAMLWYGTADSAIDLTPPGYFHAWARSVRNNMQVGYGYDGNWKIRALVWQGSAESVIDLNAFLPPGYHQAQANGIDPYGNIIGAAYSDDGHWHPVIWEPWQ